MLSTGTPFADSTETNVCLISLGTQLAPSPAAFVMMRNALITLFAVNGVPTLEVKIRPCSAQTSPPRDSVSLLLLPLLTQRFYARTRQRQGAA